MAVRACWRRVGVRIVAACVGVAVAVAVGTDSAAAAHSVIVAAAAEAQLTVAAAAAATVGSATARVATAVHGVLLGRVDELQSFGNLHRGERRRGSRARRRGHERLPSAASTGAEHSTAALAALRPRIAVHGRLHGGGRRAAVDVCASGDTLQATQTWRRLCRAAAHDARVRVVPSPFTELLTPPTTRCICHAAPGSVLDLQHSQQRTGVTHNRPSCTLSTPPTAPRSQRHAARAHTPQRTRCAHKRTTSA